MSRYRIKHHARVKTAARQEVKSQMKKFRNKNGRSYKISKTDVGHQGTPFITILHDFMLRHLLVFPDINLKFAPNGSYRTWLFADGALADGPRRTRL